MAAVWTPERRDLQRALDRLDPVLAGLYGYALTLLNESPVTMERVVLAAHSVRELVNNLPETLGDIDGLPTRVDTSTPCRALAKEWDQHVDLLGSATSAGGGPPVDEHIDGRQVVAVPAPLLVATRKVVVATNAATGNAKLRYSAVALGRLEGGHHPTLRIWQDAMAFFLRYAHLDKARQSPMPSKEEFLAKLGDVETILAARLGQFFDTAEELIDLTTLANRRRPKPPSGAHRD